MFPRFLSTPLFPLAIILLASGGLFFLQSQADSVRTQFLNNEALYVQMSTSTAPALPLATSSSTDGVMVPILAYHIVRPSYPNDSAGVRELAQTPEVFDAQMHYLGESGYHVISFQDLENHFSHGTVLPPHPIIISFDDGWSDQFQYAFPILEKYHYTATFFVFTNPIGTRGFLTWENLETLLDAGMTIGSHSRTHPYLSKIQNPDALMDEIYGSKKKLEDKLHITVNEFAYPFGQYNPTIVDLVKKAGYASARSDRYTGGAQSADLLYELNAMNVPATLELFMKKFPPVTPEQK